MRKHDDEERTTAPVHPVAMINAAGRLGVIVHHQSGSLPQQALHRAHSKPLAGGP
ncbi:hypothetical protein [Streptomyces sp. Ru62]|uniref:hypothetical protein n=1 Tax=Streptomyces sp. Ru62 TaxID=2080745 RepID=UPI0015E2D46D|nr:hypothetical protein [Streptomyces sp. Ru62]